MGEGKGIGLVLAGGGGKGAYQVGVLKVLQEQGLLEDIGCINRCSQCNVIFDERYGADVSGVE